MAITNGNRTSVWFWVASLALLVWGLGGAVIYVAYFVETPGEFAETAESTANRAGYAEYVANIPDWGIAVGVIAAFTRLLGAICLLLRRAWALPLYLASMLLFAVAMYRAFVIANAASVMSGAHIAIELVFAALSVFAVWFTYSKKSQGYLT